MKTTVKKYEDACQEVADKFVEKYFRNTASDMFWVGDEVGGVYVINDYFFGMDNMVDYFRHQYTIKDMFACYDYQLEEYTNKKSPVNIKNWRLLKK